MISYKSFVLVLVTASWCGPCKYFLSQHWSSVRQALTSRLCLERSIDVVHIPISDYDRTQPAGIQRTISLYNPALASEVRYFPCLLLVEADAWNQQDDLRLGDNYWPISTQNLGEDAGQAILETLDGFIKPSRVFRAA